MRIGTVVNWSSGVYLRGDEINVLGRTGSFASVNLHGVYRFSKTIAAFARIENLFDATYDVGRTPVLTTGLPRAGRVGVLIALP